MTFIHEDFMLTGPTARELYHAHAEQQPIIDYHCHLSPQEVAENIQFRDITQLWLGYDHYKWRAMRANGVVEEYITLRQRNAWEVFEKWAETVPYTMRNPLYHWTHLELKRVFDIDKILSPATAREIFEECNAKLALPEYRGQALIRRFGVEAICTTDDPADDLRWHKEIAAHPFGTKVLPTWRPDKAVAIEDPAAYKAYLERLGKAADKNIDSYADLIEALRKRHDYFAQAGCKLSDHGLDTFHAADYTEQEIELIFKKVLLGRTPDATERDKFYSALLHDLAVMDAETGWVQQFHVGPIRNNCSRMLRQAGPDTWRSPPPATASSTGSTTMASLPRRYFTASIPRTSWSWPPWPATSTTGPCRARCSSAPAGGSWTRRAACASRWTASRSWAC